MRNPEEITLRGLASSAALERYVAEQLRALKGQCERIQACHVLVDALQRNERPGAPFSVRLDITLPGIAFVVNREHGEDVYLALREAFGAAGLQLSDHMRRQSDIEAHSRGPAPGKVGER